MRIMIGALVGIVCLAAASEVAAICRVVEEPGSPPPVIEPEQPVLLLKRADVVIGEDCPPPPIEPDAGADDAGAPDAGLPDGGVTDAGTADAGAIADAGAPQCEEIRGDAITMVVQPRFSFGEGGARFALLMVTPSWPIVSLESEGLFQDLARATAPAVDVEAVYIEDESLGYQCSDPKWNSGSGGCAPGDGYWDYDDDEWVPPSPTDPELPDPDDAAAIDTIGAYEVARLTVADTTQLGTWLDDNGYLYTAADLAAAQPYIDQGWTVVAVRVAYDVALEGGLDPLAFTWPGSELRLPVAISRQPAPAETRLTVYVSAEGRYDFPGASVPYAQPTGMSGTSFLTRNNLWVDLSLDADGDPIAVPATGTEREYVTVEQEIRIPSSDCPDPPARSSSNNDEWGCDCTIDQPPSPGGLLLISMCALFLLRRRR
jgi:MYXO-CTERM domain-containing protein